MARLRKPGTGYRREEISQLCKYRTDEWWVGLSHGTIKKAWHWVQAGGRYLSYVNMELTSVGKACPIARLRKPGTGYSREEISHQCKYRTDEWWVGLSYSKIKKA